MQQGILGYGRVSYGHSSPLGAWSSQYSNDIAYHISFPFLSQHYLPKWVIKWVIEWVNKWVIGGSLSGSLNGSLSGSLNGSLVGH